MPNSLCPIPYAQFPMPYAQFPMPNSQFPIPYAQFPIPNLILQLHFQLITIVSEFNQFAEAPSTLIVQKFR
jgi:hypothetical protein